MNPQRNITSNAKNAHLCALSVKAPAYGVNFWRDHSCLWSVDPTDSKQRDIFGGAPSLRRVQLPVMALKHCKGRITLTQAQYPTPGVMNHARSLEHQLLHDRLNPTAFGYVANRPIGVVQGVLSNQTQQIHCHRSQLAHQVVGVELARVIPPISTGPKSRTVMQPWPDAALG